MIGKGQATYLQTLISQCAEAIANSERCQETQTSFNEEEVDSAVAAEKNAKRKLDKYIAKLTETGK